MSGVLVLAVDSPVPALSGARLRTLHLARQLATAFPVSVAALEPVPAAPEPFTLVQAGSFAPRWRAGIGSLRRPYQAAKLDSPALAAYALGGAWATVQAPLYLLDAAKRSGRPAVLDAYDVESDTARSLALAERRPLHRARRLWEARTTARYEPSVVRRADAVCAASDEDAARLEAMGASDVLVVPNGVDVDAVTWQAPAPDRSIVFVGNFGYRPNIDAARLLVADVLPLLERCRVVLVGRAADSAVGDLRSDDVEVHADVPDVVPFLRAARAVVVGLRAGSGTRLKILEAMAAGVPVVSTALGAAGIEAEDGRELLLAESARDLAAQTNRLLDDDDLALSISHAARRLVVRRYSWPAVSAPLIDLHARLGAA